MYEEVSHVPENSFHPVSVKINIGIRKSNLSNPDRAATAGNACWHP
jgi:hypothetical protein